MATLTVHLRQQSPLWEFLTKQHVHAAHESTWRQYRIKWYEEVVTGTCDYFPIKLKSVLVPGTQYLEPLSTYGEASKHQIRNIQFDFTRKLETAAVPGTTSL